MTVTVTYSNSNVKAEFTTNTYTNGDQLGPDVLGLTGGGFVSAYNNLDASHGFMLLNFYDAGFNLIGDFDIPYDVNHTVGVGQPVLTELTNGNVLVVWDDINADSGASGLKGALFDAQGTAIATSIALSGSGTTYAEPSVTALSNGGFATSITWTAGASAIYVAVYDADGVGVSSFVAVDTNAAQTDSHLTALSGGGFVITWTDHSGANALIQGQTYDNAGVAQTGIFTIGAFGDNTQSSVAAMQNGDFAVVYTDNGWSEGGTLGNGITLQIFAPNGDNDTPGTFIHVNTSGIPDEVAPDVTVLANGFILVTWTHPFSPTDNDIYARLFDSAGNPITVNGDTDEFVITGSGSNDTASAVSALLGGDYIVSWQDDITNDGSGGQITSTINEFVRTVVGDGGADVYLGDELRDSMNGGGGEDTLGGAGGNDTIIGGSGDDSLAGGSGNDQIEGGLDNDIISGGDGDDKIFGLSLADQTGSVFADTLFGDDGNDTIIAASGSDSIEGGAGDDKVLGHAGDDTILGGDGDDKLKGGKGADLLQGGLNGDTLIGAGGDDVLYAATQAGIDDSGIGDTMLGGGGNDTMTGSGGGDNMLGGIGADTMDGRDGADSINGGAGKDIIIGGGGADQLTGGADKDVFTYLNVGDSTALGADLITDLSNKDRIDLSAIDADNAAGGDQAFHLVAAFTSHAGELVVTYHTSGPLTGLTTIEGDINGDGVADLTITASGDHHAFTAFVL